MPNQQNIDTVDFSTNIIQYLVIQETILSLYMHTTYLTSVSLVRLSSSLMVLYWSIPVLTKHNGSGYILFIGCLMWEFCHIVTFKALMCGA